MSELAPSSVQAFIEALNGGKGDLDAWLECNNEAEVRAHIRACLAAPPAAPAPAVPNGAVPPGSWEHLKVMMQHSAWEGTLQLCDALANIEDFAKSAAPAVPDNIADLLEDYVMARVETALFNNHVWPQGTPVRMAKPRKDKLMSAIGASLSAAPAVPAVCDGGTCGLGGYCANCPRLSAAPAVREPLTDEQADAISNALFGCCNAAYRQQIQDALRGIGGGGNG